MEHRNNQFEALDDCEKGTFLANKRVDGNPYPSNMFYSIATGLIRHFKDDIKRFDLNILS